MRQIPVGDEASGVLVHIGQAVAVRVDVDRRGQVVVAEHVLEVRRRRVDDDGLSPAQRVLQESREPRVPAFGHAADLVGAFTLLRIEVNVAMLGLQHLEGELAVLHLVAAEVLGVSG
jgi:hypothetical protein